jgi:hypothetical protein
MAGTTIFDSVSAIRRWAMAQGHSLAVSTFAELADM